MADKYDIVIVGGGIVGISVAVALADEPDFECLVLERDHVAAGSTGRSVGGVRQQFSDRLRTRLMRDSHERFTELAARSTAVDFRETGYLFLAQTIDERDGLAEAAAMQREVGLPVEMLKPTAIAEMVPALVTEDITGGRYCSTDGVTDPHAVTTRLAAQVRERGVTIRERTAVTEIVTDDGAVTGVRTAEGRIDAESVVIAAGVWTPGLVEPVGVSVPIKPTRIQVAITEETSALSPSDPFIVDVHERRYLRYEPGPAVLVGGANTDDAGPADPATYSKTVDHAFRVQSASFLEQRTRGLADIGLAEGWAGLKGVTPDGKPLVGPVGEVDGLLLAAGFNGHGFMLAPTVGACLGAWLLRGRWGEYDLSAFNPDRFDDEDRVGANGSDFMGAGGSGDV